MINAMGLTGELPIIAAFIILAFVHLQSARLPSFSSCRRNTLWILQPSLRWCSGYSRVGSALRAYCWVGPPELSGDLGPRGAMGSSLSQALTLGASIMPSTLGSAR